MVRASIASSSSRLASGREEGARVGMGGKLLRSGTGIDGNRGAVQLQLGGPEPEGNLARRTEPVVPAPRHGPRRGPARARVPVQRAEQRRGRLMCNLYSLTKGQA